MAYQSIGLGSTADDGTGDTLRTGGDKANDNSLELYQLLGGTGISASAASGLHKGATITDAIINNSITAADDVKIKLGTGTDLELYHSSGNNYIESNTGELYIQGDGVTIRSDTGTETMIEADVNGGVVLHYNGSTALTTTATGVTIAQDLTVTGDNIILTTNTSGHIMVGSGSQYAPVAVSGDVTISSAGVVTIANDSVEEAMMANDAIGQAELKSVVTLLIYDSGGSVVKTLYGAGA